MEFIRNWLFLTDKFIVFDGVHPKLIVFDQQINRFRWSSSEIWVPNLESSWRRPSTTFASRSSCSGRAFCRNSKELQPQTSSRLAAGKSCIRKKSSLIQKYLVNVAFSGNFISSNGLIIDLIIERRFNV